MNKRELPLIVQAIDIVKVGICSGKGESFVTPVHLIKNRFGRNMPDCHVQETVYLLPYKQICDYLCYAIVGFQCVFRKPSLR